MRYQQNSTILLNRQTKQMPTLFVNDLTNIDCSILHPERGLIGASWATDIELSGELDEQSMVFDFAKVKQTIKRIIDQEIDHKLLVPIKYSGLSIEQKNNLHLTFINHNDEKIKHESPYEAVCQLNTENVTRSNIIEYLTERILNALPNNVTGLKISLREENTTGNYFSYSHGLKKHDGNCQRIAHGHRSQIQIWHEETRNDQLEKSIATDWQDIYLGSQEDITEQTSNDITFAYRTKQGDFSLSLPKTRIHIMPNDSTVECIAEYIALKVFSDTKNLKVKAFEGIGKGAIAYNQ